jgi:hypothetical protein
MCQLECQAMPYLCEVAHDGVLCTFSTIDQPQTGTSGMAVRAGGMDQPPRTKSHPGHSTPASQAGRRVGPAL